MSRVINRSSPTTFNVSTNSRTTVMIDQPDRTRVYCNDLTRRIWEGAVSEDQKTRGGLTSYFQYQTNKKQKDRDIDACVIRTHAPEGIALAGQRVNHSAKAPYDIILADVRGQDIRYT